MDVREKLIKLLDESRVTSNEHCVCINGSEYIADYLIKNGVTVQECSRWHEMIERIEDGHTGEYYDEVYYNCLVCDYASGEKTPFCPHCGAKMDGV